MCIGWLRACGCCVWEVPRASQMVFWAGRLDAVSEVAASASEAADPPPQTHSAGCCFVPDTHTEFIDSALGDEQQLLCGLPYLRPRTRSTGIPVTQRFILVNDGRVAASRSK